MSKTIFVCGGQKSQRELVVMALAQRHGGVGKMRQCRYKLHCSCMDGCRIETITFKSLRGYKADEIWVDMLPSDEDERAELFHCVCYKRERIHTFKEII